jgi:hypothetical protein
LSQKRGAASSAPTAVRLTEFQPLDLNAAIRKNRLEKDYHLKKNTNGSGCPEPLAFFERRGWLD